MSSKNPNPKIVMDIQRNIKDIIKTQIGLVRNNSTSLEEFEDILTAKINKVFEEKHRNDDIIKMGDQQTESEERFKAEVENYLAEKAKQSLGELLSTKAHDGDLEFVRYLLNVHRETPEKIDVNVETSIPDFEDEYYEATPTPLVAAVLPEWADGEIALELLTCDAVKVSSVALTAAAEKGLTVVVKKNVRAWRRCEWCIQL
eukprot:377274_1